MREQHARAERGVLLQKRALDLNRFSSRSAAQQDNHRLVSFLAKHRGQDRKTRHLFCWRLNFNVLLYQSNQKCVCAKIVQKVSTLGLIRKNTKERQKKLLDSNSRQNVHFLGFLGIDAH